MDIAGQGDQEGISLGDHEDSNARGAFGFGEDARAIASLGLSGKRACSGFARAVGNLGGLNEGDSRGGVQTGAGKVSCGESRAHGRLAKTSEFAWSRDDGAGEEMRRLGGRFGREV